MAASALQTANTFIALANEIEAPLDQLKLQKLLYLAQGISLAVLDERLILEDIEAWRYGPVIPSVYRASKAYGREPILKPLTTHLGTTPSPIEVGCSEADVVAHTLQAYGHYTGVQLIALTHDRDLPEGRPWAETYSSANPYANPVIPEDLMRKSFRRLEVG